MCEKVCEKRMKGHGDERGSKIYNEGKYVDFISDVTIYESIYSCDSIYSAMTLTNVHLCYVIYIKHNKR